MFCRICHLSALQPPVNAAVMEERGQMSPPFFTTALLGCRPHEENIIHVNVLRMFYEPMKRVPQGCCFGAVLVDVPLQHCMAVKDCASRGADWGGPTSFKKETGLGLPTAFLGVAMAQRESSLGTRRFHLCFIKPGTSACTWLVCRWQSGPPSPNPSPGWWRGRASRGRVQVSRGRVHKCFCYFRTYLIFVFFPKGFFDLRFFCPVFWRTVGVTTMQMVSLLTWARSNRAAIRVRC